MNQNSPLGEPLPGTPVLSHAELGSTADNKPLLNRLRITFGNELPATPDGMHPGSPGDWIEERFPSEDVSYLHRVTQWIGIGDECPIPTFEWRQGREHTDTHTISPRAARRQFVELRELGHISADGRAWRMCIHVREGIGNRVSDWSNAVWFDVDASGHVVAHAVEDILPPAAAPRKHPGDRRTLVRRCRALGFSDDEAKRLADLIASHNNPTKDDPIGRGAWSWLIEQMNKGHELLRNITTTARTLHGLIEAARKFWDLFF